MIYIILFYIIYLNIYIYTALFQGVFPTSSCHGLAPVAPPFCSAHLRHETPPDRRRWPATPKRLRMRGGWALHNVPRNTTHFGASHWKTLEK